MKNERIIYTTMYAIIGKRRLILTDDACELKQADLRSFKSHALQHSAKVQTKRFAHPVKSIILHSQPVYV